MQTVSTLPTTPPLRAVRQAQGFSLREVSRQTGIDPGHLSRIERGEASPSLDTLTKLASVLGLNTLAGLLKPYQKSPAAPRAANKLAAAGAVGCEAA